MSELQSKQIEEFNISVPWGHIAVKSWGSKDDRHIILVHGTGDNAGTFDNLIPLLSNGFYYICIDLPSHGKSSHYPQYLPIHTTDHLIVLKLVVDYFMKEKYIYIGHSLGGQIGYLFAQLYPNYIEKFISLDAIPLFFPVEVNQSAKYLRNRIDQSIDLQEKLVKEIPPSYNYEELLSTSSKNRYHGEVLTKNAAEALLKRASEATGDGKFIVTTDPRMKAVIDPLNDARYKLISIKIDPVNCPVLVIFAKNNTYPRKKYSELVKGFTKQKNVTVVYVDGKHDVHSNNPQLVAKYVNKFLLQTNAKL